VDREADAYSVMDDDPDIETWCDECGELGWVGICPACVTFALEHPVGAQRAA
jgi:hypothetical protein